MTVDPRTPCVVGVAQHTVHPADGPAPEPLDSWEQVARSAADDAGAPKVLEVLDSVQVVYCMSWPYDDPVARLADRLGADPRHRTYSGVGGTVPLQLLADVAGSIAAGDCDAALVVGAEALATKRALKKAGERAAWSHRHPQPPSFPFERAPHRADLAHELFQAYETFALFDSARRGSRGVSLADDRSARGAMMARMTEVAAANPHAWQRVARTADELVTPTSANRMVAWPYTKLTVAVMDVDMAAGALVVSTGLADSLGVPEDRRVYLRGYAYAEDPWTVAAHDDLTSSPAMRWAFGRALGDAGTGVDEIGCFDLYSCFSSSLRFACDALGLDPLDARGLTVTGGLPFAGGPASNYTLHALASLVERVRAGDGPGLLTGVGMHMTKHAATVWSGEPGAAEVAGGTAEAPQPQERPVVVTYDGQATVAAYTVVHGRDGSAESGSLVVDLPDGPRAYARVREPDLLADAESRELVGTSVTLTTDGKANTATW